MIPHAANWWAGWIFLLAGVLTAIPVGLRFDREDFWGGYASFRRRLYRLGHVALAALGMLNLLYALSPWPAGRGPGALAASACFIAGGLAMPAVCFLTAWRPAWRRAFFLPVTVLVAGVLLTLLAGGS